MSKKERNICPKCGARLKPLYMKQECPSCHINLTYYKMDERLEADAENAQKELEELWQFVRKLDKARLIEKICAKSGKPLPWEN